MRPNTLFAEADADGVPGLPKPERDVRGGTVESLLGRGRRTHQDAQERGGQ